ncbi:phosphohistidine phosphatase [Natronocella acetinitrilica]|jgi:phosphohistidine phosphatase|uniref:Phosphohistidine phosphatase n=1 Tax=Natronocella acetinitrilica TaxID=414046 RepID=A0AAE3KCT7_9GAMM|nr:histidine phosphatase family protein [Natronocella acetinitrilica]MCP1676084.1 phosphohistidine phosphatase [Natronocella acetinitrilica]
MQRLVLFRHGVAQDPDAGVSDVARALTDKGRKKTDKAARGLASMLGSVDVLVSSPLLRALQTTDLLEEQLHAGVRLESDLLEPAGSPEALLEWVAGQDAELLVLVGHEPLLNLVAGLALTGKPCSMLAFKKAGACLLEFPGKAAPGTGLLRWHMTPAQVPRPRSTEAD